MADVHTMADRLKLKGNECFQKGKYNAAIDMYTEAITLRPLHSIYFSNRALCYSKLLNWKMCASDANAAILHDESNAKAYYLLGISQRHFKEYNDAIRSFDRATSLSKGQRKSKAFLEDIANELAHTRREKWLDWRDGARKHHHEMINTLYTLFQSKDKSNDHILAYVDHMGQKFETMFTEERDEDIPEYFCCPISLELMRDPVSTPHGKCYERSILLQHLKVNGPTDPLTRERLTIDMLRRNTNLRQAIQAYAKERPYLNYVPLDL